MRTNRATAATLVTLCAALAVLLAGCTGTGTTQAPATAEPGPDAAPLPGAGTADVVEQLAPSVVTVRVGDDGLGSGVVFRSDVILTNEHVVADATEVDIEYADGTSSPGTVLATDRITDLALVRTARTGLPVPEYRTDLPRPGDAVLAIGSPLGFENSVTAGIVSGLNRQIPGSAGLRRALVDLIQVDAPISPGNSGGALLDAQGRVIGINEAYIPPAAGAVSLGFAIPAGTAVDVADQLLADGVATHPFLGVSLGRVTPQIRDRLGVAADQGALVLAVTPDGPAASAGLSPGDVVTSFGDRDVAGVEDLLAALRGAEPGDEVPVGVVRGGEQTTATVTVGSVTG
jgi:serine protease Do